MKKILIFHQTLGLGGGEKYVYEIAKFAKQNSLKPIVVIPYLKEEEYYDSMLKDIGVKVVRINLSRITSLFRNKMYYDAFWNIKLRYFGNLLYKRVHIINLGNYTYSKFVNHNNKCFWHIGNIVQYNNVYPFDERMFMDRKNTIVYINKYQVLEVKSQYKEINCKEILFKLFVND